MRLQGGDRGGLVRIGGGLYAVEATEALVNEGEGGRLGIKEQNIVVAANFSVERSQALWGEIGDRIVVKRGLPKAIG